MNDTRQTTHPQDAAERQKAVLLRFIQLVFIVMFVTVTMLSILGVGPMSSEGDIAFALSWPVAIGVPVAIAVIVILIDVFTPEKKISTLFSVFLGLLAAMLATVAIGFIVDLLVKIYGFQADRLIAMTKMLVGIALSYLAITTVLQTQDDFRLVIPYVEFAKQIRGPRPLLLDTSALIDARIADIGDTGILQAPLIIPRFVVSELQALSDSADKLKRARGRRGLEIITRLQRAPILDVSVDETPVPGKAVDQMLVELARRMPATIVTTDVALGRVAQIHDVPVLNLNDLANALKPAVIPGEQLTLTLIKPGEHPGQGVGYLDDGTMVVVEDGSDSIGEQVKLQVTSSLQTSAGRLIFGRIGPAHADGAPDTHPGAPDLAREVRSPAADEPEQAPGSAESQADGAEAPATGTPVHQGPFPPKRPNPRASRARNPRR